MMIHPGLAQPAPGTLQPQAPADGEGASSPSGSAGTGASSAGAPPLDTPVVVPEEEGDPPTPADTLLDDDALAEPPPAPDGLSHGGMSPLPHGICAIDSIQPTYLSTRVSMPPWSHDSSPPCMPRDTIPTIRCAA